MISNKFRRSASAKFRPSVRTDASKKSLFRLSVIAVAVIAASPSNAQQAVTTGAAVSGIEELLVVRSRNRLENQQDVPISISLVQGVEIDRLLANDINSIVLRTANISWNQGNQRTSSLSIRGIGKQGQTEAQDPSVGVIVDGVSYAYNALTNSFDFWDVDTIEVVRGPQGTLLGKNASVGVVNVTTRRPSFEPTADGQLTIGDRNTVIGRATLGGTLIEDLVAWRTSFTAQKGEGYQINRYNQDITYQNKDRLTGRAQLLFTPTPDFSARIAVDSTPRAAETTNGRTINTPRPATFANGAPNTSLDNETRLARPYFTDYQSFTINDNYLYGGSGDPNNHGPWIENDAAIGLITGSNGGSLELNWNNVGPFDFTSITAYKDFHFDAGNDEGTPFSITHHGGNWIDYRQASQEFRVSSDVGDFVNYQGGLYFLRVHNVVQNNRSIHGGDAGAWFASNAQYGRLDVPVNPDGSISGGRYLLSNSLNGLQAASSPGVEDVRNDSYAAFAQANWNLSDRLVLTTGIRFTREDRSTVSHLLVTNNGAAPELNPVEVNGVQLGGFASNASTGALLVGNSTQQLNLADLTARKYFGATVTSVPGAAYNSLTAQQQRQLADAKAIRQARIGVQYHPVEPEPFRETQPAYVVSPVFRLNDEINLYAAWQYGEKAGISQVRAGRSELAEAEENNAFEVGIKSVLFDNSLVLNADVYYTNIKNYQQGVRIVDEIATALNVAAGIEPPFAYITVTGNVPKVRAQGLEIDGLYSPSFIPNTRIRFAFAYTDTYYVDFPNAAVPSELGFPGQAPYIDFSGRTLPGTSKYSGNLGIEWNKPLSNGRELFFNANVSYQDKYNSDNSLSEYGWIPSRTLWDTSFGYGSTDGGFGISLIAKNLFDQDVPLTRNWTSYTPPEPRWLGVLVTGSF